jgi:hypothetical protein
MDGARSAREKTLTFRETIRVQSASSGKQLGDVGGDAPRFIARE